MVLNNIINKENFDINWDFVEQIPEFNNLKKGGYHNQWHMEGSSWEHTKNVVEAAYNLPEWNDLTHSEKYILICTCLFHDIGKSVSNTLKEDGNYSAPHHAKIGERMTRYMLWNESFNIRETICSLIRYHMKPNHLIERGETDIDRTVIEISHNSNTKLLYLLTKCDSLGATSIDKEDTLFKKELLKERADALDCFGKPFEFHNEVSKFHYFNKNENDCSPYLQVYDDTNFTIYMMSGVAGSGKDTYLAENLLNLPIVSRDLIRLELGYVDANGKFKGDKKQESKVTEREEERIKEYCRNRKSFIYNNMNIREIYVNKFIKTIIPYNPKIECFYIETSKENVLKRRKGQISEKVLLDMFQSMDMVRNSQFHNLICLRN